MVTKIVAEVFPYDRVHDTYQEYYRDGLKASLAASGGNKWYNGTLSRKTTAFADQRRRPSQ